MEGLENDEAGTEAHLSVSIENSDSISASLSPDLSFPRLYKKYSKNAPQEIVRIIHRAVTALSRFCNSGEGSIL